MPFLNENEIKTAKMCVANIKDKLYAIEKEVTETQRPYKHYLKEKLDSIISDTRVLNSMIEGDDEDDN